MLHRPITPSPRGGWCRLLALWGIGLLVAVTNADAQVQRAFTARYSTNTNGEIGRAHV